MPTNIAGRRSPRARFFAQQRAERLGPNRVNVHGPWEGLVTDIESEAVGFKGCVSTLNGLVTRGGILTTDDGTVRVQGDPADLPLGDDSAGVAEAPATNPQPIVGLYQNFRRDNQLLQQLATTGDNGGAETGHLFRVAGSGSWTAVPFAGGGAAQAGGGDALCDFTSYPPGIDFTGAGTGGGHVIFTNDVDNVYAYDPVDDEYRDISDPTFDVGVLLGGYSNVPVNFKARSVCTYDERLVFCNTVENSVEWPQRVRWTNPSATNPDFTATGAGAADLVDLKEELLRVETFGSVVAVYGRDGVAFLTRTFLKTRPWNLTYVTKGRGLLGTHSLVPIKRDVHFGLFTDGFFFLDSSGRFTQVGMANVGGKQMRKFTEYFINEVIDLDSRDKIVMGYDPFYDWIRIGVPSVEGSGEIDQVWVYDIRTDSIWPDKYNATYFSNWNRTLTTAATWGVPPVATWGVADPLTWGDTAPQFEFRRAVHGTSDGLVFIRDPDTHLRDGLPVSWVFESAMHDVTTGGLSNTLKTLDRIAIEFTNLGNPNYTVGARCQRGHLATRAIEADVGALGLVQTNQAFFRKISTHFSLYLAGTSPVEIRGAMLDFIVEESRRLGVQRPTNT